MGKFNLRRKLGDAVIYTKKYWKAPPAGEYVSLREMFSYGMTQVGTFVIGAVMFAMTFSAGYFCGAIMNIQYMDFYKIGIISTVMTYVLMFMNPIGVLIFENHGVLPSSTKAFANVIWIGQILISIGLYCVPSALFENIPILGMVALPQIVANILITNAVTNYITWFIRVKWCAKYGRLKPFIVLCGIPAAILISIIPFLPLQSVSYVVKLTVLHLAFTLMAYFYNNCLNIQGLVTFMTPNSQERQKMYSIIPIITSLAPSIIGLFFPVLIGLTGGFTNIMTYRIFIPIFSFAGVLIITFFGVQCKERIIERHDDKRPKVKFWKGAKQALKSKYFWILKISGILGSWMFVFGSVLQWWFIYSVRMEWFYGVAANIVVLSMTVGNLLTPWLVKKYQKRTLIIGTRILSMATLVVMFFSIKINSVVLFMFAAFLKNLFTPIDTGVSAGLNADSLDYYQSKYGERADNIMSVYDWILAPATMVLGYVLPFLLERIGFTSDWDVLYNQKIISDVFNIHIWVSFGSVAATIIPFLFYDLTREKHNDCIKLLKERLQEETDAENAENAENGLSDGSEGDAMTDVDLTNAPDNMYGNEIVQKEI